MSSSSRRAVVVYNPTKLDADKYREVVAKAASRHGWDSVRWVKTSFQDPGYGQTRAAISDGASMVVAAGGDGTVRLAASALQGTGVALGILPVGTGNLLARNLKLPLDPATAVDALFDGETVPMDMCHAHVSREDGSSEDLDFVVMAGVGIDAQMIANTNDTLKRRFGVIAYGIAIARSLRGGNNLKTLIRWDGGEPTSSRIHSLIIGNCGELVGNIALIPDARANDGVVDIVTIQPSGMLGWLLILGRIGRQMVMKFARRGSRVTGEGRDLDALRYRTAKALSVRLDKPEMFEVDGDEVGEVTDFSVTISHRTLNVRVTKAFARSANNAPGKPETNTERL